MLQGFGEGRLLCGSGATVSLLDTVMPSFYHLKTAQGYGLFSVYEQ